MFFLYLKPAHMAMNMGTWMRRANVLSVASIFDGGVSSPLSTMTTKATTVTAGRQTDHKNDYSLTVCRESDRFRQPHVISGNLAFPVRPPPSLPLSIPILLSPFRVVKYDRQNVGECPSTVERQPCQSKRLHARRSRQFHVQR